MADRYAGQVVVVTGAGSGIGEATARQFAAEGARVYVVDIDLARAVAVAAAVGGVPHAVDVRDAAAVQALIDAVVAREGRLDVLHNNAGIGHGAPIEATSLDVWRRVIDVNLYGVIHGIQSAIPHMLRQGAGVIVNTASLAGVVGFAFMAPYCASKHAVVGLSESLDQELRDRGVRVLVVCPGVVQTRIFSDSEIEIPGVPSGFHARLPDRFGVPAVQVAQAVLDAIDARRPLTVLPASARALWWTHRLNRSTQQAIQRAVLRRVQTMARRADQPLS